jgi:hypothetical protein
VPVFMAIEIRYSRHAKMRLIQRNLNEETVNEIIRNPDYTLDTFLNRKVSVKRISDKLWHVVYAKQENIIRVVTVYYE